MKKPIILAFAALLFFSCGKREAADPAPAPTEITSDTVVVVDSHNAQNSLDYLGMYKGKLPCADCAGIETSIQLSEDFSYTMTQKYLGKTTKTIENKGTFSWNKAGNAIVLDNLKEEPNQFFVGEGQLKQLDLAGNPMTGKLADSYILKKLPESQAAKTDAVLPMKADILAGTKWKITQLNGSSVKQSGEREYFVEFRKDGGFGAFAGCNSMGGKFEVSGSKIKLFNIMSTRMACEDMKTESDASKALESSDNFVSNNKVLQLRKGNITLMKLDAITAK